MALGGAPPAAYLAPTGHRTLLAGAAVVGLAAAVGGAWLFLRWPWLVPLAALACVPARIPVKLGSESANLLVPLYGVVVAAGLALAWRLIARGRPQRASSARWPGRWPPSSPGAASRSPGARICVRGRSRCSSSSCRSGCSRSCSRGLPWSRRWLEGVYGLLGVMAVVFAFIGLYQWANRDVFWNPKVIVANAYAPSGFFYRVNSVFYDPSIYGRFLVLAILASLVIVLYSRRPRIVDLADRHDRRDLGRAVLLLLAVELRGAGRSACSRRPRSRGGAGRSAPRVLADALLLAFGLSALGLAAPSGGINRASSDRYKLITNGLRIALAHPVQGVGIGGFKHAYADPLPPQGEGAEEGRVARHSRDGRG